MELKRFTSELSGAEFPLSERISAKIIRKSLLEYIQKEKPDFNENSFLALSELNTHREKYIANYLIKQLEELTNLEKNVLTSIDNDTTFSDNENNQKGSFGQRVADKVASFGGSWRFIILFGIFLLLWILANVYGLANKKFDPILSYC